MLFLFQILEHQNTQKNRDFDSLLHNINGAPTGNEVALDKSVILIPGVGHFVAQVKPREFNEALDKIISEYKED